MFFYLVKLQEEQLIKNILNIKSSCLVNEMEVMMVTLFSNHEEEILDSQLQRLLRIRGVIPEEEKNKWTLTFGPLHSISCLMYNR